MKPTNNRIYCIGCRRAKMLFESEAKAANFIKFNQEEIASSSDKVPLRSYYCSFCCGWHVTSVDDEDRVRAMEERDKRKWDNIHAVESGKRCRPLKKLRKLGMMAPAPKYLKFQERIIAINNEFTKSENLLMAFLIDEAWDRCQKAIYDFHEAEDYASSNGILFDGRYKLRNKLELFESAFDIIGEYDVDHETRMSYLKFPKENINKYARRYLQAKDFFEEMNNKISEMETLADYGIGINNETDIMTLKMEIEKFPLDFMMAMKKQFLQRLAKIQASSRKIPSGHGIEGNNKFLYMSVIEILEKVYLAFEKKDLDGCTVLIKTAECLMPDDSDEIGDAIWLQINAMKDRLGYA